MKIAARSACATTVSLLLVSGYAAAYPPGPYGGTNEGAVIENLSFTGYMDTDADADHDPYNEAPRDIDLAMFSSEQDPEARVLVIDISTSWCGYCQDLAEALPGLEAKLGPRGARFLTVMSGEQISDALAWGQRFHLTAPTVADPTGKMDPYINNGFPSFVFVDTRSMAICEEDNGIDASPEYVEQTVEECLQHE